MFWSVDKSEGGQWQDLVGSLKDLSENVQKLAGVHKGQSAWRWLGMAVTLIQVRGDALHQGEGFRARERMEAQGSLPRWNWVRGRWRQGSGVILAFCLNNWVDEASPLCLSAVSLLQSRDSKILYRNTLDPSNPKPSDPILTPNPREFLQTGAGSCALSLPVYVHGPSPQELEETCPNVEVT